MSDEFHISRILTNDFMPEKPIIFNRIQCSKSFSG